MWRVEKGSSCMEASGKKTRTIVQMVLVPAAWDLLPGPTCCLGCTPEQLCWPVFCCSPEVLLLPGAATQFPGCQGCRKPRPRTIVQCSNVPICPDVPIRVNFSLEQHPSPARFCSALLGNPSYPEQFIELCYLLLSEARILALA